MAKRRARRESARQAVKFGHVHSAHHKSKGPFKHGHWRHHKDSKGKTAYNRFVSTQMKKKRKSESFGTAMKRIAKMWRSRRRDYY